MYYFVAASIPVDLAGLDCAATGVLVGINVNGAAPTSILIRLGVFDRNRLLICRRYLGGDGAIWPPHGDLAGPCRATHSKI